MRKFTRAELINLEVTARGVKNNWLQLTVDKLKKELQARGIKNSGELIASLEGKSGYNVMILAYLLYGQFVDMGVGRGRTGERNREVASMNRLMNLMAGKRTPRRAKKYQWYSRRMGKEMYKLSVILADLYADAGVDAIMSALPLKIELKT